MRMLKSNLLIKKLTNPQIGKVATPDSFEDEWSRGEVIGYGPDTDADISIGDIIIFPPLTPYGNSHPIVGSEGYIIIPETYIWAIENDKEIENGRK